MRSLTEEVVAPAPRAVEFIVDENVLVSPSTAGVKGAVLVEERPISSMDDWGAVGCLEEAFPPLVLLLVSGAGVAAEGCDVGRFPAVGLALCAGRAVAATGTGSFEEPVGIGDTAAEVPSAASDIVLLLAPSAAAVAAAASAEDSAIF